MDLVNHCRSRLNRRICWCFFMARRYMMKYFKENPPIDERMITQMMASMGQKPSKKKVQQIMAQMKVRQ